LKEIHHLE
jgi:hypothetical protein